jgi:hypothetical protein
VSDDDNRLDEVCIVKRGYDSEHDRSMGQLNQFLALAAAAVNPAAIWVRHHAVDQSFAHTVEPHPVLCMSA